MALTQKQCCTYPLERIAVFVFVVEVVRLPETEESPEVGEQVGFQVTPEAFQIQW